ncbi:MAG: hypothetical protein Fur005_47190 [Roseiflexaceae bacterium]
MSLVLQAKRLAYRALSPLLPAKPHQPQRYQHWSIAIYRGSGPLDLRPDPQAGGPVLTAADIRRIRTRYIADPFLMREGNGWLLFFEMVNLDHGRGTLGLAHSDDSCTWRFVGEILREPFHLSYPFVFEWQGQHFMVPETSKAGAVRLYRAEHYPETWVHERNLIEAPYAADATPIFYQGRWWMFVEMGEQYRFDTLRLFHAEDLRGPWIEHPRSPIVVNDPLRARPGGRPVIWQGRLIRFAQAVQPVYGAALRAIEITTLNPEEYQEQELCGGPLYQGSGGGWNALGMHHLDPQPLADGTWIGAVDGCHWGLTQP